MVRPWVVPYSAVDCFIGIASAFCTKLPYGPIVLVLGIEKGNEAVEGVAVGSLRISLAGAGAVRGLANRSVDLKMKKQAEGYGH